MNGKSLSHSKTVLVVDDDLSTCLFFKSLLTMEGLEVETAFDGKTALSLIRENPDRRFDLVILDLMMPGHGGYELLKELEQPRYPRMPIFVVTAFSLDKALIDMIQHERDVLEYWSKPIDTREFRARVHEILGTTSPTYKK